MGCIDSHKACALGDCKALEWAKGNGRCQQEQYLKPIKNEVKMPPADVSVSKKPEKQSP